MFIDETYFVGELTIPNTDQTPVLERLQWFIKKYEPIFLQKLFGYAFYKAFVAGINVTPPTTPDQRYLDILYGCEYTDYAGYLQKWKGLIVTDSPIYNLSGGLVYRKPEYLTAGVTNGLDVNATSATFLDWIGWTPQITRIGFMEPGVDYNFDSASGIFSLLKVGDKFGNGEKFKVEFDLRTDAVPVIDFGEKESIIAYYVYYWFYRSSSTSSTGVGEIRYNPDGALIDNPNQKMAFAWNQIVERVEDLVWFMDLKNSGSPQIYPEFVWQNRYDALNEFRFMNTIF
jgi:hypothetical protein